MQRVTRVFAALLFVLATIPLMFSQGHNQPNPAMPSGILGPQLIAWSQVQKPQPVSQPLPVSDRSVEQLTQDRGQATSATSQEPPRQPPTAQTLTGTIVKDGSLYLLNVSGSKPYELDDQDRAKQYEGKRVKVAGTLDAKSNSFHVISIELIS